MNLTKNQALEMIRRDSNFDPFGECWLVQGKRGYGVLNWRGDLFSLKSSVRYYGGKPVEA